MTHNLNVENTMRTSAQRDHITTTARTHAKIGYMRCTQANCEQSSLLWMGIWSLLECLKSLAEVERIIVLSISLASVTWNLPGQFSLHQMTSAVAIVYQATCHSIHPSTSTEPWLIKWHRGHFSFWSLLWWCNNNRRRQTCSTLPTTRSTFVNV